jgi:histidine 2-aminobutanoyltransferase
MFPSSLSISVGRNRQWLGSLRACAASRPSENYRLVAPPQPRPSLHQELSQLKRGLELALQFGSNLLRQELDHLCNYLSIRDRHQLFRQLTRSNANSSLLVLARQIRDLASQATSVLEKQTATVLCTESAERSQYFKHVSLFAAEEGCAAELRHDSKLLFVGSGAIPISALSLARQFDCEVTCLDIDPQAVELSRRLLSSQTACKTIDIQLGDIHTVPDLSSYTHVWIASLVPQKLQVLEALQQEGHPECRVLIRFSEGLGEIFNYACPAYCEQKWHSSVSGTEPQSLYQFEILRRRR